MQNLKPKQEREKGVWILAFALFFAFFVGCLKEEERKVENLSSGEFLGYSGNLELSGFQETHPLEKKEVRVSSPWLISPKLSDPGFSSSRSWIPEFALVVCDEGKIEDDFLVDAFVSVRGSYGGENVLAEGDVGVAGNLKVEGNVRIRGDVVVREGGNFEVEEEGEEEGKVQVEGEVLRGEVLCPDFSGAFERASGFNDNELIPDEFLEDGKLELEGVVLELPSGVYYLRGLKLEGGAELRFSGITFLFVDCSADDSSDNEGSGKGKGKKGKKGGKEKKKECLKVEDGSRLGNFPDLRVFVRGSGKVEGDSEVWGLLWVSDELRVEDRGKIFGGAVASRFKAEDEGAIHRDVVISDTFYFALGKRINLIFDLSHPILRFSNDTPPQWMEDLGVDIIAPFIDGTYLAKITDISVYSSLLASEDIDFIGHIFLSDVSGAILRNEIIADFEIPDEEIKQFLISQEFSEVLTLGVKMRVISIPVKTSLRNFTEFSTWKKFSMLL